METATIVCPACGGHDIPLPVLLTPAGYVIDGTLLLLKCRDCDLMRPMPEFVHVADA